jgi:hypothetical protein
VVQCLGDDPSAQSRQRVDCGGVSRVRPNPRRWRVGTSAMSPRTRPAVRGRADEAVVEGQGARLDGCGGSVAADGRHALCRGTSDARARLQQSFVLALHHRVALAARGLEPFAVEDRDPAPLVRDEPRLLQQSPREGNARPTNTEHRDKNSVSVAILSQRPQRR